MLRVFVGRAVKEKRLVVDEPGRHRDVVLATGGDASRWNRGL
jgi:hypothetical protein